MPEAEAQLARARKQAEQVAPLHRNIVQDDVGDLAAYLCSPESKNLTGNILYLAGPGPLENGKQLTGKLGRDVSVEEGYRRARLVGLGLLAAMRDGLGTLDRVDYIVKLLGMVNATPDFNDSPKVINGCSDLFVEVFGEAGRHARSAVGNVMLPNQISVEIEGIVAIKA